MGSEKPARTGDEIARYEIRHAYFDHPSPVGGLTFKYGPERYEEAKKRAIEMIEDREIIFVEFRRVEE